MDWQHKAGGSFLLGLATLHLEPVHSHLRRFLPVLSLLFLLSWRLLDLLHIDDMGKGQSYLLAELLSLLHSLLHCLLFRIHFLTLQSNTLRGSQENSLRVSWGYLRKESTRYPMF